MILDLSESELVRSSNFFNLQLEGIFIRIMFHDVIIHIDQNSFFTFFEDFSYFIKRNLILVGYLEQKKASTVEARRLLALSSTHYFTKEQNKKSADQNNHSATALPYEAITKSWTIA